MQLLNTLDMLAVLDALKDREGVPQQRLFDLQARLPALPR